MDEIVVPYNCSYKPQYAHVGDSGFDLCSTVNTTVIFGQVTRVPVGLKIQLRRGYDLTIRPRSGLASCGLYCILGTVDSSYRGEISVLMTTVSNVDVNGLYDKGFRVTPEGVYVPAGARIAQGVITPVVLANFVELSLNETDRGEHGFGSTGH